MAQQAASLAVLFFAMPTRALAGADDWSDFTNNFATDLAPIIVLFGEQASKQFLSESTSVWDNIIFGIAPIGIITAIVSAIRLYGSSPLKAFIGRAQEAHGAAEAELCSSTSEDVCELWSNGGICRVFGRPRILEFFHIKEADDGSGSSDAGAFYPSFERQVNTKRPPACGLYPPQSVLLGPDELPHMHDAEDNAEKPRRPKTGWKEIGRERDQSLGSSSSSSSSSADLLNAQERGRARAFAPHPNLSLNIGIRAVPLSALRATAALGTLLQLSFFGFAIWATFYYPDLYEGESLPSTWSFCLAISGTVILTVGMIGCAMLIEKISRERRFRDESHTPLSGTKTTTFWLQPGNQRVGDQLFNAFAYSKSKTEFITSWKVDIDGRSTLMLWAAIGSSVCGFACQFIGLRGLHGSVALYQLAVTLCMAVGRSLLRSGRLGADENKLKQRRGVEGHELDWQAMNIEEPGKEFKGGWYLDDSDLASPLQKPQEPEKNNHAGATEDDGVALAPGTRQMAGFRIRRPNQDIDPLQSARTAVLWAKYNEIESNGRPNEAARILYYRASLAYLTGDAIRAPEQRWETRVRATAQQLQRAIQEAAEYIFSEMEFLKGWGETRSLLWSTTCRLHEPPTASTPMANTATGTGTAADAEGQAASAVPSHPIHFALYHNAGLWEISDCQLEAALGLWYWSVSQLPFAEPRRSSSQSKIFMVDRRERQDALVTAIRLWVTQTHDITPVAVRLPSTAANDTPSPHVSDDGPGAQPRSPCPTTLSVPLMAMLQPFLRGQEQQRHAGPGPAANDNGDGLDGVCLSISTKSSLLQLVAQDLFGVFFTRIADVLKPLDAAEPLTRRAQTLQTFGVSGLEADAAVHSFVGLTNKHIHALADVFEASGIGSREDALMTMIPPLLQRGKLPETLSVMESLLRTAKTLRRSNRFTQAEKLLLWLVDNVPQELQTRAVMNLGYLYRHAVRSNDPFDRDLGRIGYETKMKALADDRLPPLCPNREQLIDTYTQAWHMLRRSGRGGSKKPLGPLVETLKASNPSARPLGLYIVDEYDVDVAATEDLLSLLRWAIGAKCPELIEDLWSRPRICNLFEKRSVQMSTTSTTSSVAAPLLSWAVELEADAETIEALLDWPGLDTSPLMFEMTPLAAASEDGHYVAVDLLLKRGVSPDELGGLPLLLAVEQKHLDVVRRLLQAGASTNATPESHIMYRRTTPLHAAIGWDSTVVELLLDHRADPNSLDVYDKTPLDVAVEVGDAASVDVLLRRESIHPVPGRVDLLRKAIQRGDDATAKLLARQVDLDVFLNRPFLHDAVRSRNTRTVELLLERGVGTETRDDEGKTPLLVAIEEGLLDMAASLLGAKADPNARNADKTNGPLPAAVVSGNIQMVDLLLNAGAHVEAKDNRGRTPLLLALELEAAEHRPANEIIIASLLHAHADPNVSHSMHVSAVTDGEGTSKSQTCLALHLATKCYSSKLVGLLVQHGAQTELRDGQNRTPLLAVLDDGGRPLSPVRTGQQKEMVRRLLAVGADPNATGGGECCTALQAAARLGHEDIVHELLSHGADVHAQGGRYGSALQAAATAWAGDEIVQMLLEAGADPTARGGEHGSALHAALATMALPGRRSSNTRVLEMLLRHGADTGARNTAGLTPLLAAIDPSSRSCPVNVDAVRLLLKHGANTEATDGEGRAPLHIAAALGNTELVRMLLDCRANMEARDERGRTPLLAASERGHKDAVELLLERGANVDAEGGFYGTATRGAMYRGDEQMADMLRRFHVAEERA